MCANYGYTQQLYWDLLARLAKLSPDGTKLNLPESEQFYPGQFALVILQEGGVRIARRMYWGLVPDFWRKPLEEKRFSTFNYNSRASDWLNKPTFAKAIRSQRCLIPATYFCEYAGPKGNRQAIPFQRPDGEPFALAGVWNFWSGTHKGEPVSMRTFSMLTTAANDVVAPIHPKAMPVILEWEDAQCWLLDPINTAKALVRPCPNHRLVKC